MSDVIELKDVSREFRGERIIDGASLSLEASGVSALVAPNGSGKTTLMTIVAGLMKPTGGPVAYLGGDGPHDVALLLAGDKNLYMKNTVGENLLYLAALNGRSRRDIQVDLDETVSWFAEIEELWRKPVEVLSYGQKRMVALASAVVSGSRYLLVDEAAEGLDVSHVERLVSALRAVSRRRGVLVSSHDLRFVSRVTGSMIFLREGRVLREEIDSEAALRGRYTELFGEVA